MARYVDANKVIENIRVYKTSNNANAFQQGINFAIRTVCRLLSDNRIITTADVQEVKHGEWGYYTIGVSSYRECSLCGENSPSGFKTRFCPHCGAKMDRKDET